MTVSAFLAASALALSPDPSFGTDGVALVPSALGGEIAVAYGLFEDAKGRLVVGGIVSDSSETVHMAAWRFLPSGAPDRAFGKDGVALAGREEWAWAVAPDAEGRIVLAGFAETRPPTGRIVLRRLLPDGTPDPAFTPVSAPSPLGGEKAALYAVQALPDGRIAAAGAANAPGQPTRAVAWSFKADGALDPSFGDGGWRVLTSTPTMPGPGEARVQTLLALGSSLVAGGTIDWKYASLWKLDAKGQPDAGFGSLGMSLSEHGVGRGLLADRDGSLWMTGFAYDELGGSERSGEFAILSHYGPDGLPARLETLPTGGRGYAETFAIAAAADGRRYAVGYVADTKSSVRGAVWQHGREPVLLPALRAKTEDRLYAVLADRGGRVVAGGFSRGADGRMRLVLWRLRP